MRGQRVAGLKSRGKGSSEAGRRDWVWGGREERQEVTFTMMGGTLGLEKLSVLQGSTKILALRGEVSAATDPFPH